MIVRRTAIAATGIGCGMFCRLEGDHAIPDPDATAAGGIAVGPYPRFYPEGSEVTLQTDGGIMMGVRGQPVWVELHRGLIASRRAYERY